MAHKGNVLKQLFRVPKSYLKNVACYESVKNFIGRESLALSK